MQLTVKQARRLADKKQSEIANAIGVCEQTYRRIEREPWTATIAQGLAIARYLGVSFDSLFFDRNSNLTGICADRVHQAN